MENKNHKRLVADIPVAIHQEIKVLAAKHNVPLTRIVLQALVDKIREEKKYD